ncbi:reductase component of dioxygenase system [Pseudomonas syringae pv. japonica str. M301072]|uniref:Reductase component of dioxygenase system n=1 Tax=Pseudomonas syringae pv. japonica str. M301072 TaxID=629262 RepID=F3FFD6_PSESX|nr:reductase component of dioxygenase system [Pseudomonas syringae pv. japonica str. M301072]
MIACYVRGFFMSSLFLKIEKIEALTPRIRRLLLTDQGGGLLPQFTPGAHLELHIPGERKQKRAYSIVNVSAGKHYEIAVQLDDKSTGGSSGVHTLTEGQIIEVDPPRNHFPLVDNAKHVLLIAGGIGITPMLSMGRALQASRKAFTLHYAGRDAANMAYLEEVQCLANNHCWISGGDASNVFPAATVLANPSEGTHLYICGPAEMITAVIQVARELGWPDDHVHYELFAGSLEEDGDQAFEVELRASGMTLAVNAGQTLLDVMIEAGLDPMFDCRRGDCGVCVTQVIEGEADHRDICLSERERSGGAFCTCVSRAKTAKLVLDL